jgi:capsid protein
MIRLLGISLGLPLEMVLLDYSQSNYSSSRAANLQAQRSFRMIQELFIDQVLSRIYRWRISKFIKDGELDDRPDSWSHRWSAPNFPQLDPQKEAQGKMLEVDAGHKTLHQVHAENGTDYDAWLAERAQECADIRAAGIPQMRSTLAAEITSQPTTVEDLQARIDQIESADTGETKNDQSE